MFLPAGRWATREQQANRVPHSGRGRGGPAGHGWSKGPAGGLSLLLDLLAGRGVGRLPWRVTESARVVRTLVALARTEVPGDSRRRRNRQRCGSQDAGKHLAPHSVLLLESLRSLRA